MVEEELEEVPCSYPRNEMIIHPANIVNIVNQVIEKFNADQNLQEFSVLVSAVNSGEGEAMWIAGATTKLLKAAKVPLEVGLKVKPEWYHTKSVSIESKKQYIVFSRLPGAGF